MAFPSLLLGHGVAAGFLAIARLRASMRAAPSSWLDHGTRVACLGFAVATLHAGHGSPAIRMATTSTGSSGLRQRVLLAHLLPSSAAAGRTQLSASACAAGDSAAYQGSSCFGDDVVIVAAYRTPICKAKRGGFKDTYPEDLLTPVFKSRPRDRESIGCSSGFVGTESRVHARG